MASEVGSAEGGRKTALLHSWVGDARPVTGERVAMYSLVAVVPWLMAWVLVAFGWSVPGAPDFVAFWAAGRMVVEGQADAVYEPLVHHEYIQIQFPDAEPGLPFFYPPPGLMLVAPFGVLPFAVGFVAWGLIGLVAYARGIYSVVPRAAVLLAALAIAPTLWNVVSGQSGLLAAAATVGFFHWLDRRSLASAACLAVFLLKPHLALLLPVVLLARRQWGTLLASVGFASLAVAVSGVVFGWEQWIGFVDGLRLAAEVVDDGSAGRFEMQSLYPVLRGLELPSEMALVAQATIFVLLAAVVWRLWRHSNAIGPSVVAVTVMANLLASPRVFTYDAQLLGVAAAYVVADALDSSFLKYEKVLLIVVGVLPLVSLANLPATFVAMLLMMFVATRRLGPLSSQLGWVSAEELPSTD